MPVTRSIATSPRAKLPRTPALVDRDSRRSPDRPTAGPAAPSRAAPVDEQVAGPCHASARAVSFPIEVDPDVSSPVPRPAPAVPRRRRRRGLRRRAVEAARNDRIDAGGERGDPGLETLADRVGWRPETL